MRPKNDKNKTETKNIRKKNPLTVQTFMNKINMGISNLCLVPHQISALPLLHFNSHFPDKPILDGFFVSFLCTLKTGQTFTSTN